MSKTVFMVLLRIVLLVSCLCRGMGFVMMRSIRDFSCITRMLLSGRMSACLVIGVSCRDRLALLQHVLFMRSM